MNSQKLRRVWWGFCGIAGMLFIAMWARSYWWVDTIDLRDSRTRLVFESGRGEVGCGIRPNTVPIHGPAPRFQYERYKPDFKEPLPQPSLLGFVLIWNSTEWGCLVPYWALIFGVAAAAFCPRLTWRFSLRALLIFATLIAVLLAVMRALV